MKIAIFGGSFDPVHSQHVSFVERAIEELNLDKVLVVPSRLAPHKRSGAVCSAQEREKLLKIAFRNVEKAEICDYELRSEGVSYTYLTCRRFKEMFPGDELFLLVGEDMLEDFFTWKNPEDILSNVTLAVCGRGGNISSPLKKRFHEVFQKQFVTVHFVGKAVSSTRVRVDLAFGKRPEEMDGEVLKEIEERELYRYQVILDALALEKEERREHSYRVAKMACARARSVGVEEKKALFAAAMHDCGKYVPLSSPLLEGFTPPEGVPDPVMHQFTGAYLAEHEFHVTDGEILDAIRFHTSAREDMTPLGKLIFLADMLEEDRTFRNVKKLRGLFWHDLDECFYQSLKNQNEYLQHCGKPVYELTRRAYQWLRHK